MPWSRARPGIALGIITADCAPVLFADPEAGVIGAAHAGWRGAVDGVLEATLAAMAALGAAPRAASPPPSAPASRQPSYEVGPDLRDAVLARDAADARFFAAGAPRRTAGNSTWPAIAPPASPPPASRSVETAGTDTLANEDRFFSHRRRTLAGGGPIGHQLSAIAIAAVSRCPTWSSSWC